MDNFQNMKRRARGIMATARSKGSFDATLREKGSFR